MPLSSVVVLVYASLLCGSVCVSLSPRASVGLTANRGFSHLQWPERVFHCENGVTALDFSANNVSLLAVGMYDGSVAMYNVHSRDETPTTDTT